MFKRRIPLKVMSEWCRSLASCLQAGLPLRDALRITGKRGRPVIRSIVRTVDERLADGDEFDDALAACPVIFPPLFVAMVGVAQQTGHLPEVLRDLDAYFAFQVKLRRQFLGQVFWPVMQLVAAILIIALVIYILGIIQGGRSDSIDTLGLGLRGTRGAILWLSAWFGGAAFLFVGYYAVRHLLGSGDWIDRLLLKVPVLGETLRLLALSRLCIAMKMTLDSALSVLKAVPLALRATDNGAFSSLAPAMRADLRGGASLMETFAAHPVFPDEFLDVLTAGEETGTVPEAMGRLGVQYNERAEHQMQILNTMVGWGIWAVVAGIIIVIIFKVFSTYAALLNSAGKL